MYRELLGGEFERLDEGVQISVLAPLRANGIAHVEWGNHLLARILRMPKPGAGIPVKLNVSEANQRQTWHRMFGQDDFLTKQTIQNGLLVEQFGPASTILRVEPDNGSLIFESVGATFLGLNTPSSLTPKIRATVIALGPTTWRTKVSITWRGILICQYEVELVAE